MLHKISSSSDEFEQAFFQLAYDKLQNKLHNLLPYLVGFEVVNKSEDNTKAVGVFGFKSDNGQVMLIPAFFVNGKIKDLDILYSRNNNQFYPLNEDFAETFLKDDVTGLGSPANEPRNKLQKLSPPVDFRDMAIPPRTGRTVVASVIEYLQDSDPFVKTAALALFEKQPELAGAIASFYPVEKLAEALVTPVKESPIKLVTPTELKEKKAEDLTNDEKTELLTKGYLLLDKRAADQVSKFGLLDVAGSFTSPQVPGKYSYVASTGQLIDALILKSPQPLWETSSPASYLVYDQETNFIYATQQVITKTDPLEATGASHSALLAKLKSPAEVEPSNIKCYVLVDENLHCSEPFQVTSNGKGTDGIRRLQISRCCLDQPIGAYSTSKFNNSFFGDASRRNEVSSSSWNTTTLVFTKKPSGNLESRGNVIYVPKNYKLLSGITELWNLERDNSGATPLGPASNKKYEAAVAKVKQRRPGSLNNLVASLESNGVLPFSARRTSGEYFLDIGNTKKKYTDKKASIIGLVLDVGLTEKAAHELLDSIKLDGVPIYGQVKLAYTGDYTPAIVEEAPWSNELGQETYSGIPYVQTAPIDDAYQGDPTRLGLGVKPDTDGIQGEVGRAVQLAQTGQKEIFDSHTIATISKYVDPTNKVVSYIPNFVDSLDKLGRMLFMLNWETDKFQEMYGTDELPELLELIKNVFKNLGDLVIFLKRKYPDVSINTNEQSGDKS